ncbi:potassium channel family protein [Actibacterium atlanticum]|uniref:potassium channel family protein n=1 Tax=Actibacterium atlanticum TaxID=1461693 RepID=UPI0005500737|nr:potassium channel family protein [Actibacterium atlanticum]
MSDVQQIVLGTGLLTLCAVIHVAVVAFSVPLFGRLAARLPANRWPRFRIVALLALAVLVLVFAHTVQVWIWAVSILVIAALPDLSTSFYFATVTYTTLGYGDIVLGPEARIVATFCAITGLLTFGISTAFLIGVLTRILPDVFKSDRNV